MNTLPKVLLIDVNAWRQDLASNTLMDIFRFWSPDSLAVVYTSSNLPNSEVCSHYFQIGENQVMKSVYKPWLRVGRRVSNTNDSNNSDAVAEHNMRKFSQRSFTKLLRMVREMGWKLGRWRTPALKEFVRSFNPDIIFVPIFPYAYMGRIQKYIIKLTNKPTVCYLSDDNYSYDSCKSFIDYLHRFWVRQYVGPLARNCNEMFVIIDKEKKDTDSRFGTNSVILTKAIDFTGREYKQKIINETLKFVYTGSLAIGRGESLAIVADVLNKLNGQGLKAELNIYSQTTPTKTLLTHINNGCSHFYGVVSHQEIDGILQEADVVIFAEALEGKQRYIAKLSFSTKITDYLASGKCILAIGDKEIAPIDYFKNNDSAIIATNSNEIESCLVRMLNNHELVLEYGKKAFECARRNHDLEKMKRTFMETMMRASDKISM